jgi:hypothetical protein
MVEKIKTAHAKSMVLAGYAVIPLSATRPNHIVRIKALWDDSPAGLIV